MKKIVNKPTFPASKVFDDCVSSYQKQSLRDHYNSIRINVISESRQLEMLLITKNVHLIVSKKKIGPIPVTKDDMTDLYDNKLVRSVLGRQYYDKIMLLATNGKCPFCGVRNVKTLDHFMPKSLYPIFSITPINLSPCCSDCNKEKTSVVYTSYVDTPLNPYFDDFNTDEWLFARFNLSQNIPVFEYYSMSPSTWSTVDYQKIRNHCDLFNLFDLYQIEANSEYIGILNYLKKIKGFANPNKLKTYFEDLYVSHKSVDLNSYQTAMYRCLMNNHNTIFNIL